MKTINIKKLFSGILIFCLFLMISRAEPNNTIRDSQLVHDITVPETSNIINDNDEVIISPIPSTGRITILGDDIQGGQLQITSLSGQKIYEAKITSSAAIITLQTHPGIYFLTIKKENKHVIRKIIIE